MTDRQRSRSRLISTLGLWVCGLGLVVSFARAAKPGAEPEPMIKAAIVFNLRHFVVWPDSDRVVHIGVLGEGPVAEALVRLDGRGGSGGHVAVRRIEHLESGEPLDLCFVGEQVRPLERDALVQLSERGVLTVSDGPDFLERGGILQLVVRDRRVHLRVQLDRARRAHLQLRAQLLKLAEVVND